MPSKTGLKNTGGEGGVQSHYSVDAGCLSLAGGKKETGKKKRLEHGRGI